MRTTKTAQEYDPWLGGPSGSSRYTEPQRRNMIDECIKRDSRGCSCGSCKVHPKGPCPFSNLPAEVDIYRILTPQHGAKGNGDHHLSNLKAFCQPCNRNALPTGPYPQHRVSVRKSQSPSGAGAQGEQSVRLVQRHEWERPAWDEWVVTDKPWDRLKQEGLMMANGWALLQDLVELAASQLVDRIEGKGSSVTFRRYAMEDRFTVLEMVREKGRIYVRPKKERRKEGGQ